MANAKHDENHVPTLIAALNSDGATIVPVCANEATHSLCVVDDTTGSDHGPQNALHDGNFVPTLLAVSSTTATVGGIDYVQGVTPVVVYADSNGKLLIDSA
jgi:hypothetical protein